MTALYDDEEAGVDDGLDRMALVEHLAELRKRLIIAIVAIVAGAVVVFAFYDQLLGLMIEPYEEVTGQDKLVILSPLEGFSARLKLAGFGGIFLASPIVLFQVWRFITPGLHKREKRYAIPFIAASVVLFAMGATLAIFTFPRALEFLVDISGEDVETLFSPEKYVTFVAKVIIAFGIAFEFPILLVFLQLANVVSSRRLLKAWRGAVVGTFAAAAVITPSQDPVSMLAMALPMSLFYFLAILVGRLLRR